MIMKRAAQRMQENNPRILLDRTQVEVNIE